MLSGPELRRAIFLRLFRWKIVGRYKCSRWASILHLRIVASAAFLRRTEATKDQGIIRAWLPTALFALLPWGTSMLNSRPCFAWTCWAFAGSCAAYALWQTVRWPNWLKLSAMLLGVVSMAAFGLPSIFSHTELNFPFVNPGLLLIDITGTPQWLLIVTGRNTHVSLFNVQITLQDMMIARAVPLEPDPAKRDAMIRGEMLNKTYPEIGPTFLEDKIVWTTLDVNDQEYNVTSRYRIGEDQFISAEEIRIINSGNRVVAWTRADKDACSVRNFCDGQESVR